MTKRRGVTEKDKATKAAKTTKTIRTYVANSSRDYNKERDERREEGSEHEQDNLHGQDVDIGEGNNRQDDDIERIILEQEERNIEKERRENKKKEMERRDKERREKERRKKERREKERTEKERRERDRREKDKEQEENENDKSVKKKFRVLHLANKMLDASTKQPSTNLPLTTSTSSPSDNDNYHLIDEEMKCLFLRTRNLPDHAFDKITQKIFGHDAYQSVAKSINKRYLKGFRQIVESGYTESSDPTDEEVNNFISQFSRKCFKIVWVETESANIKEKVKELDVITEDLEIPSRSGRNIASSLKLHLFS
ncbi:protein split ends isoform X4 [Rhizophagus clarus]|uniref:Protein split ends isoform X4 n=1 Tax=Rhizophagus clarus TaxID=94130 RepID=A0A8H3KVA7_9GLOM|nr:protein split ends isoform X4 [Rhizophagus clarus]